MGISHKRTDDARPRGVRCQQGLKAIDDSMLDQIVYVSSLVRGFQAPRGCRMIVHYASLWKQTP